MAVDLETVDLVQLQFTDLSGTCKMVEMTGTQAKKLGKEGYAICQKEYLKPDWETLHFLPWESSQEMVGSVVCDICDADGNPIPSDSRIQLKKWMKKAEELGLQISFTFQCECYLFHRDDEGRPTTITHEVAGLYDAGSIDLAGSVRRDILCLLSEAGIQIESMYHGRTPGQHCFLISEQAGVYAGDVLQTLKAAVKRIAKSHGLHAAFMPKPMEQGAGSGLRIGVVLRAQEGELEKKTADYFCAGLRKHLRELLLFTNPLVNSYKRLAEEAMDRAVYQQENPDGSVCIQCGFPDPSANPYLALAAILSAGLDGICNQISWNEMKENPAFPETMGVLLEEWKDNRFVQDTFGEELCRRYAEGKKEEWNRFCTCVTDWETREYLYRC